MSQTAGTSRDTPLYFRWVQDDDGGIRWGRVLVALGLTVLTAWLSVQTQRSASSPDFARTIRMSIAQRKITAGVRLQRIGKTVEDAGWAAYETARR